MGSHIAGTGYAHTNGDIDFNPVLLIEDAAVELHTFVIKYVQPFEVMGKSARIDLVQAYHEGKWEGLLDGVPSSTRRSGLSDSVVRFSVNLLGAPPLKRKDYVSYRASKSRETIIGTGLAIHLPTGNYYDDKLINLGSNRITIRPQLGVVHTWGNWSMELTGVVWFFMDNDDFYGGSRLENDPFYTIQGHLIHTFKSKLWMGAGIAYGFGKESTLDGRAVHDKTKNLLYALSMGYPISARLGASISYIATRTQTNLGGDTDSIVGSVSWVW